MEDKIMEDFTKRYFRNWLIFSFVIFVIFLVVMLFYLDRGAGIGAIPFAIICVVFFIDICFQFRVYWVYNHNKNAFEGTITNVSVNQFSYQMVIKSDDRNYIASYYFIFRHIYSSYMKDKVGRKCSFIVNKRGKAYIRYYL